MKRLNYLLFFLGLLVSQVSADCYMHNPPGSNDRLNEQNTNRNNANRLFNSQNNAKGGYCTSGYPLTFYEGSLLSIEWTTQHACGNPKLQCNVVLQYMCGEREVAGTSDPYTTIRDGAIQDPANTNTIPVTNPQADGATLSDRVAETGSLVFGMHEPYDYYIACATRDRNYGLFVSDRVDEGNLNDQNDRAVRTRQSNNGERFGFECPEERDYYPYWHPSPWKDIAFLVDESNKDICKWVKAESQNVKEKNYCQQPDGSASRYNNEIECTQNGDKWLSEPAWGIDAPDCVTMPFNRDNHLGNGASGYANTYNWTLPTKKQEDCIASDTCSCVLRIRYNITSGEFIGYGPDAADYRLNAENSPVNNNPTVPIVMDYPSDQISNDGADYPSNADYINMKLAIDTTQFGRTFQDRSHVFRIRARPSGVSQDARIYNLNVRGKRGNIVQAYPAVEYDFVPETLEIYINDFIHFQWTGCDKNPAGNAGEGTDQTDRHNMVQIEDIEASYPVTEDWFSSNTPLFDTKELRFRMAYIDQPISSCNPNTENDQALDNCKKLNAAPTPYFDGGLLKMNSTGQFSYMSTRNNNFTNRSQKASIVVSNILSTTFIAIVAVGGGLFVVASAIGLISLYSRAHPHSSIGQKYNALRTKI